MGVVAAGERVFDVLECLLGPTPGERYGLNLQVGHAADAAFDDDPYVIDHIICALWLLPSSHLLQEEAGLVGHAAVTAGVALNDVAFAACIAEDGQRCVIGVN